ncbi:hypothetical protein [Desulfosarcina ovata]|nr:hypothetical protein [Desulfosarcina ovata]
MSGFIYRAGPKVFQSSFYQANFPSTGSNAIGACRASNPGFEQLHLDSGGACFFPRRFANPWQENTFNFILEEKEWTMTETQKSPSNGPTKGRDFFIEMAKHPRSRVIMANTSDTYMMADITRQGDIIISRLRDELMRSITIEDFTRYMDEYYKIIFGLEDHLQLIGSKVGIDYRPSRTYKSMKKKNNQDSMNTPTET